MTAAVNPSVEREILVQGSESALEGGGEAWRVLSGLLAVFAVELRDHLPRGPRRYLFDVSAGEILVKMKRPEDARHSLIAVAVEPAVLASLEFDKPGQTSGGRAALETWSGKLNGRTPLEFFEGLAELDRLAETEARSRLQEQFALNRRLTAETLLDLTGSVPESRSGRSALLDSVQAVADAQGINNVRVPADLDAARDPLQTIALTSGIRTRPVLLRGTWWKYGNAPLLGYVSSDKRPIALLPARGGRYESLDPTDGRRHLVNSAFAASLDPVAYSLYRSFGAERGAWDLIRFGLQGYGRDIRAVLLCAIAVTLFGMVMPQATALLIAHAIPDADRGLLLQIAFGMAAAVMGSMLFDVTRGISTLRVQGVMTIALETAAWDWLLKLSPAFFRRFSAGELRNRMEGFSRIQSLLQRETQRLLSAGLTVTLYLGLMLFYSVPLALCAAVCGLLVVAAGAVYWRSLSRMHDSLEQLEGGLSGLMVQLINAVPKLRIAGAELRAFAYWGRSYSRKQRVVERTQLLRDRLRIVNTALPTLAVALSFNLALRPHRFDLGTFLAFCMALGAFMQAVTELSDYAGALVSIATHWRRIKTILDAPTEVDPGKANPGRLTGRLVLDHVTFRYRREGRLTLEDISIHADPGECVALVGPSGSGKSTILNLLLGFETPSSGAVLLDGHELSGLDLTAVRRQIGVVRQDSRLMSESIFENIVCGSRCTMNDAWEAARAAGLAEDIEQMPMGMHTIVSEGGSNLSGGQRQRLLIARALVLRPKILLFDEATSALDNRTQQIVTESVQRLKATRLVVAHRLSTIRQADRIYVIQDGRVVQQGSFEALAGAPGLFAQLIKRQLV